MHRNNKFSKSTKRRRLLEEQYLQNYLQIEIDNASNNEQSQISNIISSSESIDSSSDLVVSVTNESSASLNIIVPNTVVDYSYDLLEESKANDSSDDDTESESDEYNFQQPLTSELAEWAVNHNVQNTTFSNLLKILKKHKCFNDFPSDARTVYSNYSGVSYNKIVDVITVPPGIYYHFGILNGIKKTY